MLRISMALLAVAMLCHPIVGYTDFITPSERVQNSLNIRSATNSRSEIIGSLQLGQKAELLDSVPNWYLIKLPDGRQGYVHKGWTKRIASTSNKNIEVHFIDVGQGDSTLVLCPNGKNILVDIGSLSGQSPDPIRDYIFDKLSRTQRKINHLVVTHPDSDHYNLIPKILSGVKISQVFMVGEKDDYYKYFQKWLKAIPSNKKKILGSNDFNPVDTSSTDFDCGQATVHILAADVQSNFSHKNTTSIVLMIRYGDFEVVLTGDATRDTEKVILQRYPKSWLDVDVLKIGHHGSLATSTTKKWARTLRPSTAVVSAGYKNKHGHPRKEVIERLDDFTSNNADIHPISFATGKRNNYKWHNIEDYTESIFSTVTNGNVVITSDGSGYSVSTSFFEE